MPGFQRFDGTAFQDAVTENNGTPSVIKEAAQTTWFENTHVERPWQVNGHPNAIYISSRDETYVCWHAKTEAWITRYDHTAGEWAPDVRIGAGGVDDYHGAPSMTVDADGYIHVFWGGWAAAVDNELMQYAVSDSPYDLSSWTVTDESAMVLNDHTTYPLLWSTDTTLYAGFRDGGAGTGRPFAYYTSTDNGASWSGPTELIQAENTDSWIYCNHFAKSGTDVHLVWRVFDNANDTATKYFHAIFDTSDESLRAIDGTSLTTPLGYTEAVNNCEIADVSDATFPDFFDTITVGLDGSDRPYCACHVRNSDATDYRTYYLYYDGSAFTTIEEVADTYGFHSYPAITVKSATDVDIVTVVDDADAKGSQVARYNWNGSTWTQAEVVLSTERDFYGASVGVQDWDSELRVLLSEYDGSDDTVNNRSKELAGFAYGDTGLVDRVSWLEVF